MERPFITKRDIWLVCGILAAALFFHLSLFNDTADYAEGRISVHGSVVMTADLREAGVIGLPNNPFVYLQVTEQGIAFIQSDCRDQICVRTGPLNRPGQAAACLPNRVSLLVVSRNDSNDIDAVTR
jgi:hypothetical protein